MAVRNDTELIKEIARLRSELAGRERESGDKVRRLERYAADLRKEFEQERSRSQELRRSHMRTVRALANAIEARLGPTSTHAV